MNHIKRFSKLQLILYPFHTILLSHVLIFNFIVNFSEAPKAKHLLVSSHRLRLRSAFWQFWPLRCQWYLSSTTVRKFPMPIKTLLELCFIYHLSINRDSVRWPTSLVMCMQGMAAMSSPERLLLLHTLSPLTERIPWSEGSNFHTKARVENTLFRFLSKVQILPLMSWHK